MQKQLFISSQGTWDTILQPALSDTLSGSLFPNEIISEDFIVWDNVSLGMGRPIIDMYQDANILRDVTASCILQYKDSANLGGRRLNVKELYGASRQCFQTFYQGDFKDFAQNPEAYNTFFNYQTSSFTNAVRTDIATNSWWGKDSRPENETAQSGMTVTYSLSRYNGWIVKYNQYLAAGSVPSTQSNTVVTSNGDGTMTPQDAYNNLKTLVDSRSPLMKSFPTDMFEILIDVEWHRMYERYLISTGNGSIGAPAFNMAGVSANQFEGYIVRSKPIWTICMNQLLGGSGTGYYGLLTIKRNGIFGTDKNYVMPLLQGMSMQDSNGNTTSLGMWVYYDLHDHQWKLVSGLTAGIDLLAPWFACQMYSSNVSTFISTSTNA